MKGKIGNIVVVSTGGEVIGREYNPNVTNPNTGAQQNTRAKFKLASQLSAELASVIAIKKEGNVSARNLFVKQNFGAIRYSQGVADINLNIVQLTKSLRSFAGFNADRSSGTAIAVELNADSAAQLSRVVYIGYKKLADGTLQLFDSKVCSTPGADGLFADVLRYDASAVVLYAYGIKDLEAGVTSKFGNLNAPTAEDVAQLLVSNTENMAAVQLTKTAGLTMAVGEDTGDSDDVEHITVSIVTSGNGSATGGGRFDVGQQVTLRATPDAEASFEGWHVGNASGERISTANPYTFTAEQNITICAKFLGGPTPQYNIAVSADPAIGGTVSGGGSKEEGSSCTVVATPAEGYEFDGWFENNQLVSNNASYTFTVERARTLVAAFSEYVPSQAEIASVSIDGDALAEGGNVDLPSDNCTLAVTMSEVGDATHVCLAPNPTIGQTSTGRTNKLALSGSSASGTINAWGGGGTTYKPVAIDAQDKVVAIFNATVVPTIE